MFKHILFNQYNLIAAVKKFSFLLVFSLLFKLYFLLPANQAYAQERIIKSEDYLLRMQVVLDNLESPWSIVQLPTPDEFLISQRTGTLIKVNVKTFQKTVIKDTPPVMAVGQGGMLGIVLHPNFADNNQIYLSYTTNHQGLIAVSLAKALLVNNKLEDFQVFFESLPAKQGVINFGSRLVFDADNFLYVSIGDRNYQASAQDLKSPLGKILRFNDDGTVPSDNPFYNEPGSVQAIYSYGHRNPQGLFFDAATGRLFASEHGPQGGDEINIIQKGQNYGWPLVSFGVQYGGELINGGITSYRGTVSPLWYWTPSMAPANLVMYNQQSFPKWQGSLLVASLKFHYISRLTVNKSNKIIKEEVLFKDQIIRPRDLIIDDKDNIYVINDTGFLYRLSRYIPKEY